MTELNRKTHTIITNIKIFGKNQSSGHILYAHRCKNKCVKTSFVVCDFTQYVLKETTHFSVGGYMWIFTSPLRSSVNINHQPTLWRIVVTYPFSVLASQVFQLSAGGRGREVGGITVSKRVRGMLSCTFLIFSRCRQIRLKITNVFS